MFSLFDWLKFTAGAALGAAVVAVPVYLYGKAEGRQIERTASLTQSVEILRKRSAIDDQTRNMDSGGLCRALGGQWMPDGTCQ